MERPLLHSKLRWLLVLGALVLVLPLAPVLTQSPTYAQAGSRTFPETGKTVRGKFLDYWNKNGGLEQQGFPISEEMQERNETDGKTYTVQYFERAIFEFHPENQPPFDVLLSLLGVFLYKEKYPTGAPNQEANIEIGRQQFRETGKWVGGRFLNYWKSHGGLAQQGLPISDEFLERSELDGKTYKVQYFERAVFEYHPENAGTRFEVLLSQLGKFRHDKLHGGPKATPTSNIPNPTAVQPTPTRPAPPPATNTPGSQDPCANVPASENATVRPNCAPRGTVFTIAAVGFQPGEMVAAYTTFPDGSVDDFGFQVQANAAGQIGYTYETDPNTPPEHFGVWVETLEGVDSHRKAFARFRVLP